MIEPFDSLGRVDSCSASQLLQFACIWKPKTDALDVQLLAVGLIKYPHLRPTASNCTSSASVFGFQDQANWSNGRLSKNQLDQVNQGLNQTTYLCPLP